MAPQRPPAQLRPAALARPVRRNVRRGDRDHAYHGRNTNTARHHIPEAPAREHSPKPKVQAVAVSVSDRVKSTTKIIKKAGQGGSGAGASKAKARREKLSIFRRNGKTIIRIFKVPAHAEKVEDMLETLQLERDDDMTK